MTSALPDDVADARIRAGSALRRLGHAVAGRHVDARELDDLADVLDRTTASLATGEPRNRLLERPTGDWGPTSDGEEMFSFDERPISGRASPYGLDMEIRREGDDAVARLTLGAAHEGAPGRSHGGIVSALFDDVFGFVLSIEQQAGFTGTLTVRYEQGVPLHHPLVCRVRLDRTDGRKLFMSGELCSAEDPHVVFTTSTAVFVTIDDADFGGVA